MVHRRGTRLAGPSNPRSESTPPLLWDPAGHRFFPLHVLTFPGPTLTGSSEWLATPPAWRERAPAATASRQPKSRGSPLSSLRLYVNTSARFVSFFFLFVFAFFAHIGVGMERESGICLSTLASFGLHLRRSLDQHFTVRSEQTKTSSFLYKSSSLSDLTLVSPSTAKFRLRANLSSTAHLRVTPYYEKQPSCLEEFS